MKTKKILLIDDEVISNSFLLRTINENTDWNISQTTTIKETIDFLENNFNNDISCIILDIMIPIGNGSLTDNERILSEEGFNTGEVLLNKMVNIFENVPPIIIVSARGNLRYPNHAKFIKAILRKPVMIDELFETIKEILHEK